MNNINDKHHKPSGWLSHASNNYRIAFKGLWYCLRYEQSLRMHFFATLAVIYLSWAVGFTKIEYVLIIMSFGATMAMEIINTAVECVVDKICPTKKNWSTLSKAAKDTASGAVCMCVIIEVTVSLILFAEKENFTEIKDNPYLLIPLGIYIPIAALFTFYRIEDRGDSLLFPEQTEDSQSEKQK